jgi:hypothetical protein
MSIVDFSPTTPPANLPKFPTNANNEPTANTTPATSPRGTAAAAAEYGEPPPRLIKQTWKIFFINYNFQVIRKRPIG